MTMDPQEAMQRLAQLDVSNELFWRVLGSAAVDVSSCTDFDAPAMPGTLFWSRTNRYLAEELTPRGWKHTRRDSILRVVHPTGTHAITALSADGGVGNLAKPARSKNPKGRAMAALVEKNGQFPLITRDEVLYGRELDEIPLWCLLYKRKDGGGIEAELSLPVGMLGKYINEWHERIPLNLPDLGDPGVDIALLDDPEPGDNGPEVLVEMR
ncbi:hypothetical protein AB0J43_02295 [Nonomuraea fuscirosea]